MRGKTLRVPWIINIELTNACNLECVFCDHPLLKKDMKLGEMDDELLIKILEDVKGHEIYELGIVGLGEPTLDKSLGRHLEIIGDYAAGFKRISFNSNMVYLREEQIEVLLNSAINVYTFSVNATDREGYLKMTRKDKFDAVIENLKNFLSAMKENNRGQRVDIQVFDSEFNDIEVLKALLPEASDLNVNFFVRKVYSKPVLQGVSAPVNVHVPKLERYPCWDIYTRVYIDLSGAMYPCTIGNDSYRAKSALCVGNVYEKTVMNIFNGKELEKARRTSESGKIPFPECEKCNIWELTPNNFKWDEETQRWKETATPIRAYGLKE